MLCRPSMWLKFKIIPLLDSYSEPLYTYQLSYKSKDRNKTFAEYFIDLSYKLIIINKHFVSHICASIFFWISEVWKGRKGLASKPENFSIFAPAVFEVGHWGESCKQMKNIV